MTKHLLGAASALAIVMAAGSASAQEGWYAAVDLGYHWPDAESGFVGGPMTDIDLENDWLAFGRIGYAFNPSWRFEAELGYRPTDIDEPLVFDGDVATFSVMGNVIYDFMPDSSFRPFVGVGAGWSRTYLDLAAPATFVDDEDDNFAWQALAGFAWRLGERTSLDFTYRYFDGGETEYENTSIGPDVRLDHVDHSVTVGLRYSFGAPPPPPPPPPAEPAPPPPPAYVPPPPPAPAPVIEAKEFIVYFPFDQYILTPEAQAVVQEAASYAAQGNAASIVVTGHADTSGSAAYNVRLSERRAKSVADALVSLGVASASMSVDWKGESQPAVATGDGVKEPLNRRATININP